MMTTTEDPLSDDDSQLIEAKQLGEPLKIYRLMPSYILFEQRIGLLILIIGIVALILTVISTVKNGINLLSDFAFPPAFTFLFPLLLGGFFYPISVRQARSMRVIVCKDGLLQIRK